MNPEILKVIEEIEHIKKLDVINSIHTSNYDILDNHLSKFLDLKSVLPGNLISVAYDAEIEKWEYMTLLQNHLFNYLSSAKSLIDLTRKHHKNYYQESSTIKDYNTHVKDKFTGSTLHNFIQDLRNYVLHYGIPPLSISKSINHLKNKEVTHRVELSKKVLIESGFNWTRGSKDFFNSDAWNEHSHIRVLFSKYYSSLTEFQNWYKLKQEELFNKQLTEINRVNLEFRKRIVSSLAIHINSRKSFSHRAVEDGVLQCFDMKEAKEILNIESQNERMIEMIKRLDKEGIIERKDLSTLYSMAVMLK